MSRAFFAFWSFLLAVPASLGLSSCEGDANRSEPTDPVPIDDAAPLAAVQFPPDLSLTDAPRIGLVISAQDESGVASVRVANRSATSGPDGFWRVDVPLVVGDQTLTVETRDVHGNISLAADRVSIRREDALWIDPVAVAFDSFVNEVLVLDPPSSALFGVSTPAGGRTLISSPALGSGPFFSEARDVEFLSSRNAALVTDGATDSVFLVQLATGARSILSGGTRGGGPTLLDPHGIAADEVRNRALLLDEVRAELLAVDLTTGERTTLSSASLGTGPTLAGTRRVALDLPRNRALLTSVLSPVLLGVDLASGNRAIVSGGNVGTGPAFVRLADVVLDRFLDRILVVDVGAGVLYDVNPLNGARSVLSSAARGSGPNWLAPVGVSLDLGGLPLVVDRATDALFDVGATSGNRRLVSRVVQGAGPQLALPVAVTGGAGPGRMTLADVTRLYSMELDDGARGLVSGPDRGAGPAFVELGDVAVSPLLDPCLTALDTGAGALVDVALQSGDRTEVSGPTRGAGPPFVRPLRLALHTPGVQLDGCSPSAVVVDDLPDEPGVLLRVDLSTGDRSILSDATHGLGPLLDAPSALDLPFPSDTAIVLDRARPALFAVEFTSGDRTVLADLPLLFLNAPDLASDPVRERVLLPVANPPGLHSVQVPGGDPQVLSDHERGTGPAFGRPVAIELDRGRGAGGTAGSPVALVVDQLRGAVLAVDLVSGQRVIRTK